VARQPLARVALVPSPSTLDQLRIGRNEFIENSKSRSWLLRALETSPSPPLLTASNLAGCTTTSLSHSGEWERLISLPLFPSMTTDEQDVVVDRC
jgi:dTDP-4-amino-4,6-dideoxygalactose transaminase